MKNIIVTILPKHFTNGIHSYADGIDCPLANVLKERFPKSTYYVSVHTVINLSPLSYLYRVPTDRWNNKIAKTVFRSKKPYRFKLTALLSVLLLLVSGLFAQIPDPIKNTYINDYTYSIPQIDVAGLNSTINQIEKKTSVQIAVVVVNKLPDNTTIEDYARNIGRTWGVGKGDNGIVYVIAITEHQQRLEIANHLQGNVPDITALEIEEQAKVFLRLKDYGAAIKTVVAGLNANIDPDEQKKNAAAKAAHKSDANQYVIFGSLAVLLVGGVWWVIAAGFRRKKKKQSAWEQRLENMRQAQQIRTNAIIQQHADQANRYKSFEEKKKESTIIPVVLPDPVRERHEDYTPPASHSSSSSDTPSSSSSDYGNYGGSSPDNNSSGFDGGGASSGW